MNSQTRCAWWQTSPARQRLTLYGQFQIINEAKENKNNPYQQRHSVCDLFLILFIHTGTIFFYLCISVLPKCFFSSLFYFICNFTNFTLHLKSSHVPCFFFMLFTCFNSPTCSRIVITFWLFFFSSKTSRPGVTLSGRPFGFLFPAQFSLTSNCSHSTASWLPQPVTHPHTWTAGCL